MVQDHTKSHEELKELAHSKEVALPPAPPKAKHEMDELSKLSGAEFDRHYVAHMVAEHRMTVAEFKKASESANDIEVKVFASKSLPVLQEHLTQAESINVSIKSVAR
jgi:putative membrane protein